MHVNRSWRRGWLCCRGVLPSYIPLDLLRFLKLWDYEGSLSTEVGTNYTYTPANLCL